MICENCNKTIDTEGRTGVIQYCPDCGECLAKICPKCFRHLKKTDYYSYSCGTLCDCEEPCEEAETAEDCDEIETPSA